MSHLSGPKMVSFTVEGMYCLHDSISCDSTEKGYRTPLHTLTYTHPVWQVWDPQSCTWCHCTHEAIDSCTLHHKWWSHNVTVCTETQVHDALHMIRTGSDIAVHTNTSKYSLSKVLLGTCTAVKAIPPFLHCPFQGVLCKHYQYFWYVYVYNSWLIWAMQCAWGGYSFSFRDPAAAKLNHAENL